MPLSFVVESRPIKFQQLPRKLGQRAGLSAVLLHRQQGFALIGISFRRIQMSARLPRDIRIGQAGALVTFAHCDSSPDCEVIVITGSGARAPE